MIEYLALLGGLALVVMAGASRLGPAVIDRAQKQALAIASFDPSATGGQRPTHPAFDRQRSDNSPASQFALRAPSTPNDPAPAPSKASDGPLKRGLGVLGDAYDRVAGLVPEGAEPILREGAQTALGLGFDAATHLPKPVKDGALTAAELAVDGVNVAVQHAPAPIRDKFGSKVNDLADVNLHDFRNDEGLEADWFRLYKVWLTESQPRDLGVWTNEGGKNVVTITDPKYTGDLQSRPQHQVALDAFFEEHPDPKPGDTTTTPFVYTGPGTREDSPEDYRALESYLGSYDTEVTYLGRDPITGKANLQIVVKNESHWESGTRLPGSQQVEGRDHIVPDTQRGEKLGIGGDFHQRFVWTQEVDPPA